MENYSIDFGEEMETTLSDKPSIWTFKNILLIVMFIVVGVRLMLPFITSLFKSDEEIKNEQELQRLNEISLRLDEIWLRLEKISWIQSEIDYERDNLISEQTKLNEEASTIFLSLTTPEMRQLSEWVLEEVPLDEWQPWDLTADWDHQAMPAITWDDSHERFKEMASAYWLDASIIWNVENHYWIKEWIILCITVAETSWWNRWAGWKNIGSVGSNDRWDRPTFALPEAWLEAIGQTLNNKYLWSKRTLWCLSNAWSCVEPGDNWKRYATSESSWQKNMVACLSEIYWPIDASNFIIRR